MSKSKGKTICIFSSKGGTGKSSIAINLAGVFSSLEKRVLIIDFDLLAGSIATYLNTPFKKNIYSFVEDYSNNKYNSIRNYVTKYDERIDVLPSPKDPRQGAKVDYSYVELILEKAASEYDIVLVDTNHILSKFNVTVLDKCDMTLLTITNDLIDLKNTRNLIKIFDDTDKKNYKVLLNEFLYPNKTYFSLYDIKNTIKKGVDYIIPSQMFIKNYDNYVMDGKIISQDKKFKRYYPKVFQILNNICNDLMEEQDEK